MSSDRRVPLPDARLEPDFAAELGIIASASRSLATLSTQQAARESAIQSLCNSVWTVVQQKYSVSGRCGDQQQYTVSHQYSQSVAVVDAAKFDALKDAMTAHMCFATSDMASAIFEHALAEERLFSFAHARILASERSPTPTHLHRLLEKLVDALTPSGSPPSAAAAPVNVHGGALAVGPSELDARTLPALRRLALALGSSLLAAGSGAVVPAATEDSLLSLLYYGAGCGWAAPLVQPDLSELASGRWLWRVLVNQPAVWHAHGGALPSYTDLAPFLAQMHWTQLSSLDAQDVRHSEHPRARPACGTASTRARAPHVAQRAPARAPRMRHSEHLRAPACAAAVRCAPV